MATEINTGNDMVFKTKFKPGNVIYFVHENRVHKANVHSLQTIMKKDSEEIDQTVYSVYYNRSATKTLNIPERFVFASIDDIFDKSSDFDTNNVDKDTDERVNKFNVDYKIGDIVYFMHEDSLTDGIVKNIELYIDRVDMKPKITLHVVSVLRKEEYKVTDDKCFKEKSDLLDYLRKDYIDMTTV